MRVSFETPLALIDSSREFNDYDYCLAHLYLKYPEYRRFFLESSAKGRDIILDNSVVELGFCVDDSTLISIALELKPKYMIPPDTRKSSKLNAELFLSFLDLKEKYSMLSSVKVLGVPHGKCYNDYVDNFNILAPHCELIGVSMIETTNIFSRIVLLNKMFVDGILSRKAIHLLGSLYPIEFSYYKQFPFLNIESIDTSHPIIHGALGLKYDENGLFYKSPLKIDSFMELTFSDFQRTCIINNIDIFKKMIK